MTTVRWSLCILMLMQVSSVGCNQKANQGAGARVGRSSNADQAAGQGLASGSSTDVAFDYPPRYCLHVRKLKLRAEVEDELSYFCKGTEPTKELLALREALIKTPGELKIEKVLSSNSAETESSELKLVWGYYFPKIRPFVVKAKPIYEFISKNMKDELIDLSAKNARQPDDSVDSGMHLWSVKMEYALKLNAADGLVLSSNRQTQYNLYQVESGNEELGFGVETLTDGNNGDFTVSTMLNLSMNDGTGYNDGTGGAVILNMLHLKMNNKGFPETTSKAIDKLGFFFAKSMYDGILK
jgi:hypothetical protein